MMLQIRYIQEIFLDETNGVIFSDTHDLVTLMWANECFDPNKPDTFFEIVES